MGTLSIDVRLNPNPLAFEELALSLASLSAYSRSSVSEPVDCFQTLYTRALKQPLGYREITELAGYSYEISDQRAGRAAWLMMNTKGMVAKAVHSALWHTVGGRHSTPLLDHLGRALRRTPSPVVPASVVGRDAPVLDVAGVAVNGAVWLVHAVFDRDIAESAVCGHQAARQALFKRRVFSRKQLDPKAAMTLAMAQEMVEVAFEGVKVLPLVMLMHPETPDFELYQVASGDGTRPLELLGDRIVCNSFDYAEQLAADHEALLTLHQRATDDAFLEVPPCPGGRTLAILAVAGRRQLAAGDLLLWREQEIRKMLYDEFGYEMTRDKLRHDLVDRLIGQGFMRKWESDYFLTVKGIARIQYCRAKYTTQGESDPMKVLESCTSHRDRIVQHFGCLI